MATVDADGEGGVMDYERVLWLAADVLALLKAKGATPEEVRAALQRCLKALDDAEKRGDSPAVAD